MTLSLVRKLNRLLLALLAAGPSATVHAQQTATQTRRPAVAPRVNPPTRVASVEGLTEYRLDNGLRVLLFPDQSKPTLTVNITYFVGSRHEGYGETGMAHLLEHLLFKGTTKHPTIDKEFTERGARWNGTTFFDRTNYFELIPANDAALEWALDLEADRMVNSFVSRKDLESEMTVVRNEFESGENSPSSVLFERMLATAYLWHNYGNTTIGARSDIENVPIERLQAFYRKYYQPDNALLVIAGKFDEAKTLALVSRKFGGIPRPVRSLERGNLLFTTYTREPTQDGERTVTLRRVGDTKWLGLLYHTPAATHADYPAMQVLSSVLATEPTGRLYKGLVEPKLAANVFGLTLETREPGFFMAFAELREEQSIEVARDSMLAIVEDLGTRKVTDEEVNRAKAEYAKAFDLTLNNPEAVGIQLTEFAAAGDWRLMFYLRDKVESLTTADVQRAATTYFKPANRTVGMFIPTKAPDRAEIAEGPDPQSLLRNYTGRKQVAQGEVFDPSPTNLDARTTRTALPNGFELALLPKKTRGEAVHLRATLRYGNLGALTGRAQYGELVGAMLMRGTKSKSRQQVKDEFDRLKAQVSISGGVNTLSLSVQTLKPNLPAVLTLLREVLREPAFDPKEFELLRQEALAGIEGQKSEPSALANQALSRHLNPHEKGHPNYVETMDEAIAALKEVKVEDVAKHYADFVGAEKGSMSAVGDFEPNELTQWATATFGTWKLPVPFERIASEHRDVPATPVSIETPDKANAVLMAGVNVPMRDSDPDWPALRVASYIFGESGLDARIADRIRQKEGLSYGVSAGVNAGSIDRAGQFFVFAIFAPENAERVEAAMKDELQKSVKDGFTAEELQKAKQGLSRLTEQMRAQDPTVASSLNNQLFLDRTFAFGADLEKKIAALTVADVNAAWRKYIDPAKISIVKAGDFAGAKKKADKKVVP
ncbi:MAG TPA: pitrilysin family protein [Gemmatimonadaceae bacterium]|nr:pitrilysin family protein [Gemmatimonadaceae bacterium]